MHNVLVLSDMKTWCVHGCAAEGIDFIKSCLLHAKAAIRRPCVQIMVMVGSTLLCAETCM